MWIICCHLRLSGHSIRALWIFIFPHKARMSQEDRCGTILKIAACRSNVIAAISYKQRFYFFIEDISAWSRISSDLDRLIHLNNFNNCHFYFDLYGMVSKSKQNKTLVMKLRLYVIKTETIVAIGMHESERGRYVFFDMFCLILREPTFRNGERTESKYYEENKIRYRLT